jgi:hypothetical protein
VWPRYHGTIAHLTVASTECSRNTPDIGSAAVCAPTHHISSDVSVRFRHISTSGTAAHSRFPDSFQISIAKNGP